MEKVDRNELFSLLGRGVAQIERAPPLSTDENAELTLDELAQNITADPPVSEIFASTALPAPVRAPSPGRQALSGAPGALPLSSAKTPTIASRSAESPRADQAKLQRLLDRSVPRLWKYALEKSDSRDPKQQRQKLRELLTWLFEKEGYAVATSAPAPYRLNNREIKGRIDLVVHTKKGDALLALEADWAKEAASILKLSNWARQHVNVVWVVGAYCEPTALQPWRRFADEVSGSRSSKWLNILHLDHGWIND